MSMLPKKHSVMLLYTGSSDMESHRSRIVLAEKDIGADVREVRAYDRVEDLLELNPYHTVPTLVDRDLVLYQANIIMEYLDERFPHPPLLPVYPVARAKSRLMIHRIEQDWYPHVKTIQEGTKVEQQKARKELTESLLSVIPIFKSSPYFLSDEFSLIDCSIVPILWRLPNLGIDLPARAQPILDYAERIFNRASFKSSLTEAEYELRM